MLDGLNDNRVTYVSYVTVKKNTIETAHTSYGQMRLIGQ